MITVTKTYLPSLKEYSRYLQTIWKNNWVTNNGPLVRKLEDKLKKYLGVKYLFFVSNGTIALQLAIKALKLKGEIITTPFSYVASTSSIVWEGCYPIFADINSHTLCLNPDLIRKAITARTSAILATHVYGNPCDIETITDIARKHQLKVIYDGAHAFGVKYKNKSIYQFGDISIASFHATKLFHTGEGGAVITNNKKLAHMISFMRNFGHHGEEAFWGLGINGKNSEFHAAVGLCVLPRVKKLIKKRMRISHAYNSLLTSIKLLRPKLFKSTTYNYSYYPVIFPTEKILLKARHALNANNIYPRRYFYPSLNLLGYVKKQQAPISEDISRRILCLPLSHELKVSEVRQISSIINSVLG